VTPEELKYTEEHEWLATTAATTVRIGITEYAQQQLGDIVFVGLLDDLAQAIAKRRREEGLEQLEGLAQLVGTTVSAGDPVVEVESTKNVSEIFAPVDGEITAVNTALDGQPELINSDPYGEGWILELSVPGTDVLDGLLDATAYQELTEKD
jgi:glycine cleavage system H protein